MSHPEPQPGGQELLAVPQHYTRRVVNRFGVLVVGLDYMYVRLCLQTLLRELLPRRLRVVVHTSFVVEVSIGQRRPAEARHGGGGKDLGVSARPLA
jgi:hypothetical protein